MKKSNYIITINELLKGSRRKYFFLYLFAFILAILEILSIAVIFPLISYIIDSKDAFSQLPPAMAKALTFFFSDLSLEFICIILILLFLFKNVIKLFVEYNNLRIIQGLRKKWMHLLFSKYLKSNYLFFIKKKQGTFLYNLFDLPRECVRGLMVLVDIFMRGITLCVILGCLLWISWQITISLIILGWAVFFFFHQPISRKILDLGNKRLFFYKDANNIPAESFKGIREIKAYSVEKRVVDNYRTSTDKMMSVVIQQNFYQLIPGSVPEVMVVLFLCTTLIFIAHIPEINLHTLFPIIVTYAYATQRLFTSCSVIVKNILGFYNEWPSMLSLHKELTIDDYKEVLSGKTKITNEHKDIYLNNISFSYLKESDVLRNITTCFKKSSFSAIVGGSGSGKSTLADILIRLHPIDSGSILYGDTDIKDYPIFSWRNLIGFVSQDTFLFHGTIRENISFGMMENVCEKDLIDAAKKANAHEFIMKTENGYDTLVGERGATLSGGQRQRIAIARALIRKPKILILDEATSALDTLSEKIVMETIEKNKKEITIIVIAHRLSTIVKADNIIVLKNCSIVEEGNHLNLLERKGEYWKLYNKL